MPPSRPLPGIMAETPVARGAAPAQIYDRTERAAPIIAPEGLVIVAVFVLTSVLLTGGLWWWTGVIGGVIAGVVCLVLTLWCIWFFRDPRRVVPVDPMAVVCPADGRVVIIDEAPAPEELGMSGTPLQRICIFMNVFNVHVNRSPVDGVVERVAYRPGTFLNASFDKASVLNERSSLVLLMPDGRRTVCVQIAGLVARRIVCRVREGAALAAGERFGLIRFGSRVDVYLPAGCVPTVKVGDLTQAGSTVIARLG